MRILISVVVVFTFLLFDVAAAHTRSQSFSTWTITENTTSFVFAVDARRATQLSPLNPDQSDLSILLLGHLKATLAARQGRKNCELTQLVSLGQAYDILRISGRFECPADVSKEAVTVSVSAFQFVSATHIHIARVEHGERSSDFVLREGRDQFDLDLKHSPNTVGEFLWVGFNHVLSGLDHVVFLIVLAFVAATPKQALLAISGFTLGHTASLALVSLGVLSPDTKLVEAMIGFTIAVAALEAGAKFGLDRRRALTAFALATLLIVLFSFGAGLSIVWAGLMLTIFAYSLGQLTDDVSHKIFLIITAAFGLVHGAGFAGGLTELSLQQTDLLMPLLGFNLGVELAQISALGIVYVTILTVQRVPIFSDGMAEKTVSAVIFALGCFWFASRIWL
ncbi:HupE/UreJ family protein [Hyphococcus lacteus]|uniref:HupE/UreJ family protein n=1 Tax=Hyphococcus lacteus TaxID=3143536 RepID=A0ABV3Z5H8_9PROT